MSKYRQLGFTIIELLMVLVVVGVLSAYAIMKSASPANATLPSQAEKLAVDFRHMQLLAITSSRVLCFQASDNSYKVTQGLSCPATPVVNDPATGAPLSFTLQQGVVFSSATAKLVIDSLGRPVVVSTGALLTTSPAASYTLSTGSATQSMAVERVSGRVYQP